jgi:hypothetical protein
MVTILQGPGLGVSEYYVSSSQTISIFHIAARWEIAPVANYAPTGGHLLDYEENATINKQSEFRVC